MKTTPKSELTQFATMGMAAMLPGLQYAVELMQKQLDEFRARLAALQNGRARVCKPPTAKRVNGIVEYWARMTPAERRAEMKRRGMIRPKAAPAKAKAKPRKA